MIFCRDVQNYIQPFSYCISKRNNICPKRNYKITVVILVRRFIFPDKQRWSLEFDISFSEVKISFTVEIILKSTSDSSVVKKSEYTRVLLNNS
jgi:hypothetical protein